MLDLYCLLVTVTEGGLVWRLDGSDGGSAVEDGDHVAAGTAGI